MRNETKKRKENCLRTRRRTPLGGGVHLQHSGVRLPLPRIANIDEYGRE